MRFFNCNKIMLFRLLLIALALVSSELSVAALEVPDDIDKDDAVEAGKGAGKLILTLIQILMGAGALIFGGYEIFGSYKQYSIQKKTMPQFFLDFIVVLVLVVVGLFFSIKLDDFIAKLG